VSSFFGQQGFSQPKEGPIGIGGLSPFPSAPSTERRDSDVVVLADHVKSRPAKYLQADAIHNMCLVQMFTFSPFEKYESDVFRKKHVVVVVVSKNSKLQFVAIKKTKKSPWRTFFS